MFTAKGLFSEVVCPYEKDCGLPRCLFAHPTGENVTDTKARAENTPIHPSHASNGVHSSEATEDDAQPRKRRKLETSGSLSPSSSVNGQPPAQISSAPSGGKVNKTSPSTASTAHRDVSPPPLRRTAAGTSSTRSSTGKPISTSSPSTKKPAPAPPPKPAPAKVEALNPRMLKTTKAPASYELRLKLLQALHPHLVRLNSELAADASAEEEALILSDQRLITMTLDIEERAAIEKPSVYSNVVKNQILVYKRMNLKDWKAERQKEHDANRTLQGLKAKEEAAASTTTHSNAKPKPPAEHKPILTGLTPEEELRLLPQLYTPITPHEIAHGYIMTNPSPSEIATARAGLEAAKGWEVCDRCSTRFQVFPGRREEDGVLASGGTCTYHWGKPFWTEKNRADPTSKREKKFRCCGQLVGDPDARGCTIAGHHVFKVNDPKRLAAVMEFVETPEAEPQPAPASSSSSSPPPPPPLDSTTTNPNPEKRKREENPQPICIDGEMGYTTLGLELIRLTATSWPSGACILDTLVRPLGEILDLNSRWSGVWPEQMAGALPYDSALPALLPPPPSSSSTNNTSPNPPPSPGPLPILPTPHHARTLLLTHLTPRTPLIGHALENDLIALRLIHPTLIDTALLYPHKAGLPIRHKLKNLVDVHLGRQIQEQVVRELAGETRVEGHDSLEDANAAGWLVSWRLRGLRAAEMRETERVQREGERETSSGGRETADGGLGHGHGHEHEHGKKRKSDLISVDNDDVNVEGKAVAAAVAVAEAKAESKAEVEEGEVVTE